MTAIPAAFLVLVLFTVPAGAAGVGTTRFSGPLDTPKISQPLESERFFDTDSFLTNAGVKYSAVRELTLEPEVGLGYQGREMELSGGLEQSIHKVHAQAGWRVSLAETLHLSAAAKVPMLTVETVGLYAGEELGTRPGVDARQGYEFSNISRSAVTWRGELGIHLSPQADLTLYYDQSPIMGWYSSDSLHQEERIGTRFIIWFK